MSRLVSVVIPVFDEEHTLRDLYDQVAVVFAEESDKDFEIIFINDGSRDHSLEYLETLLQEHPQRIKIHSFRGNKGKAAALNEGFALVEGEICVTMDADLQDDPAEIPNLIRKLDEGFDLVSGWKKERKDPWHKTIPSHIFNTITRFISGVRLHDFNCGFKAYRSSVVKDLYLYGELHRYIPVLVAAEGYRIAEIPVRHFPRNHGSSKYGWKRLLKGALDLVTVIVLTRYLRRPGHFFGGLGLVFGSAGFFILLFLSGQKLLFGIDIGMRPLFFLGILLLLLGVQLVSTGLLGELIHYNSVKKESVPQAVRRSKNEN